MNSKSAIKNFTSLVDQECDIINQVEKDIYEKDIYIRKLKDFQLLPFIEFIEERLSSIEAKLKDLTRIKKELNHSKFTSSYKLAPPSTKQQKQESNKKLEPLRDSINDLLLLQEQLQQNKTEKKNDTIQKKVCVLCKCCQSISIVDKGVKNHDQLIKQRKQKKLANEKAREIAEKKAREIVAKRKEAREIAERVAKETAEKKAREIIAKRKEAREITEKKAKETAERVAKETAEKKKEEEVKTTPLSKKQKKKEKSREANRKRDAEKKEKERLAIILAQQTIAKQKERDQKRIATERKKTKR